MQPKIKDTEMYQTLNLPGETVQGLFPTLEWFNAFAKHIDFKDKTILDVGCASCSYGIEALKLGASYYYGVENDPKMISLSNEAMVKNSFTYKAEIAMSSAECFASEKTYDVVIFSMIMHWLNDAEKHVKRIADMSTNHIVFLYRYQWPDGTEHGYRPTIEELNALLDLKPIHTEVLRKDKESGQYQMLVIYDKNL